MTVAVIGDVGAQPTRLLRALGQLGCDHHTGTIPKGLQIVQVGDLVRLRDGYEPGSLEAVGIVDRFLRASPKQWFQIWGNHELAVLGGDRMQEWSTRKYPTVESVLRRWWVNRSALLALAVDNYLITHAGMTVGAFEQISDGAGLDPSAIALALNRPLNDSPPGSPGTGGRLVYGTTWTSVGCAWAEVCLELSQPWVDRGSMPCDQIHGHGSVFDFRASRYWDDASESVVAACGVDMVAGRSVVGIGGHTLTSVDNGLVDATDRPYPILLLDGSVTWAG